MIDRNFIILHSEIKKGIYIRYHGKETERRTFKFRVY